jgi:hypothetical protein
MGANPNRRYPKTSEIGLGRYRNAVGAGSAIRSAKATAQGKALRAIAEAMQAQGLQDQS